MEYTGKSAADKLEKAERIFINFKKSRKEKQ